MQFSFIDCLFIHCSFSLLLHSLVCLCRE